MLFVGKPPEILKTYNISIFDECSLLNSDDDNVEFNNDIVRISFCIEVSSDESYIAYFDSIDEAINYYVEMCNKAQDGYFGNCPTTVYWELYIATEKEGTTIYLDKYTACKRQ